MAEVFWEVVGGGDKGGVLVRMDEDADSAPFEDRLTTGSIVRQWDLVNNRLQYELVDGDGPSLGWALTKLKGKDLLVKLDPKAKRRSALGTVLPSIPRSRRCPGLLAVPEGSRPAYRKMGIEDNQRKPQLYIFLFPGAEDDVMNQWLRMERQAPEHIEFATYEWPGHGTRKDEGFVKTLEELGNDAFETFKHPMKTGHFVVCGHSIGALIALYVCERAKRELRVSPQLAVILDRGAPHLKVLSEECAKLLMDQPDTYASYFVTHLKWGSYAWTMRINDQILDQDTRPVGWYKFPCRVLVYAAGAYNAKSSDTPQADAQKPQAEDADASTSNPLDTPPADADNPESQDEPPIRTHIAPSRNSESDDTPPVDVHQKQERKFSHFESGLDHPFTTEQYKLWDKWADDVRFKELDGVSHFALKTNGIWMHDLLKEVERILTKVHWKV